jgi:hypothetical protein
MGLRLRLTFALWMPALLLSALLHWAGRRHTEPLPVSLPLVALCLLLPPLALGLWLAWRWPVPARSRSGGRDGAADAGESEG